MLNANVYSDRRHKAVKTDPRLNSVIQSQFSETSHGALEGTQQKPIHLLLLISSAGPKFDNYPDKNRKAYGIFLMALGGCGNNYRRIGVTKFNYETGGQSSSKVMETFRSLPPRRFVVV